MNTISAVETQAPDGAKPANLYRERFDQLKSANDAPAWLQQMREAGFARFSQLGFPTVRHEDWRFTNVAPITKLPFNPILEATCDGISSSAIEQLRFSPVPGPRLVFVDGHFAPSLSSTGRLPGGVKLCNLASAIASGEEAVEQHLAAPTRTDDNAFEALNAAFAQDGAFVLVPSGCTVSEPIHLVFISRSEEAGAVSTPRNLILAGDNSRVTVIESYVGFSKAATLTNGVTEIVAGDHASVEHLKFQDESPEAFHIATIRGHFGRNSNVNVHSFALGSRISRTHIRARLAGEGLECVLNGLYLTRGEQLADHHMIVEHAQPRCASHEYFNGILDDRSKGVFHGRILVQPIAQKTDAKQTNRNLLLSDDASVDTKPQLEIYADDVKCTHGATVGQMNEDSIFYLRARGIGLEKARQILMHAFAGEIIDRVKCDPVREVLDRIVWERLDETPHLAPNK